MAIASLTWHHREMIKDLEQAYRAKEEVDGVEFELVEADKWACSYDVDHFIMFYDNILEQLRVGSPFTHFQVSILNSLDVCLTS